MSSTNTQFAIERQTYQVNAMGLKQGWALSPKDKANLSMLGTSGERLRKGVLGAQNFTLVVCVYKLNPVGSAIARGMMEMWGTLLLVSVNSRWSFGCLPQDTCFWNEWLWVPGIFSLSPHHSPAAMPETCKVFKLKDQVLATSWWFWQGTASPYPRAASKCPEQRAPHLWSENVPTPAPAR